MNFENLTAEEVTRVLSVVPMEVQRQLWSEDIVLAGGAIRDTVAGIPVKDIDIFCHSEEQAERLSRELAGPFLHVPKTLFAFTVEGVCSVPVQYVFYKDFTSPEDLIGQFDFRACCAGIFNNRSPQQTGWRSLAVEGFHTDCDTRRLTFMSQKKDAGKLTALGRALKFVQRGWTLATDEAAAIVLHFEPTLNPERVRNSFRPHYGRL